MTIYNLTLEVGKELERAMTLFEPMHSPHEALGVIQEEFDEFKDEVYAFNPTKPGRDNRPRQREELIQLAAMALRAVHDTIDHGKVYPKPVEKMKPREECSCPDCMEPGLR
jgi:hypothetical protein